MGRKTDGGDLGTVAPLRQEGEDESFGGPGGKDRPQRCSGRPREAFLVWGGLLELAFRLLDLVLNVTIGTANGIYMNEERMDAGDVL